MYYTPIESEMRKSNRVTSNDRWSDEYDKSRTSKQNIFREMRYSTHALQDVSIHVEKGDIYGIIGFSGAGKSTLIRLVNGLETPDTGNVIVQGENLGNLKKTQLRKLRRKIGMVFQQFNLLESKTVYHNIALPLILEKAPKEEIDKKVKEVLRFVELEDKKDVYVSQLSEGRETESGNRKGTDNNTGHSAL